MGVCSAKQKEIKNPYFFKWYCTRTRTMLYFVSVEELLNVFENNKSKRVDTVLRTIVVKRVNFKLWVASGIIAPIKNMHCKIYPYEQHIL